VYEQFGRAAHQAQMLETDLGTALLALDALETKSFLNPDSDAYLRLRTAIDQHTLGRSLKLIRQKLSLDDDADTVLEKSLDTRNFLIHHFFRAYAVSFFESNGRDSMVTRLLDIEQELTEAHLTAQRIAESLLSSMHS